MKVASGSLILWLGFALFLNAPAALADEFWDYWGDGKAELNGYQLTYPRYGEARQGKAVSIFVTESFSKSQKVKAEQGQVDPSDEMLVLKHNCVKDFQTGIYDYNLMTMSFAATNPYKGRPAGSLVKISFSEQEWCGNTYEERVFGRDRIGQTIMSYWLNDSVRDNPIDYPKDGVSADQLHFLVRGLFGEYLARGQQASVPFLPAIKDDRLLRKETKWQTATIERAARPTTLRVPAGRFRADVWTVTPANGPQTKFYTDLAYPHKIVKLESTSGELMELTGSARLRYWDLKKNIDEKTLKLLGL